MKYMRRWRTVLTNGEIDIRIIATKTDASFDLPEGVSYTIRDGQEFLNDKPAWIDWREA